MVLRPRALFRSVLLGVLGLTPSVAYIAVSHLLGAVDRRHQPARLLSTSPDLGPSCSVLRSDGGDVPEATVALCTDNLPRGRLGSATREDERQWLREELPLFDLHDPYHRRRLRTSDAVRLHGGGLMLPPQGAVLLPELLCAPTYRTLLQVEVYSAAPATLQVRSTSAVAGRAPRLWHQERLSGGTRVVALPLPHRGDSVAPLQLRCVHSRQACHIRQLRIFGLSPKGAVAPPAQLMAQAPQATVHRAQPSAQP